MPSLICDPRAEAASLAPEYAALAEVGEPVAVYWPAAAAPADARFRSVGATAAVYHAWEDECIAVTGDLAALPLDEFTRVIVVDGPHAPDLVRVLLAAGCEGVERVAACNLNDLAQSWASGRRLPPPSL